MAKNLFERFRDNVVNGIRVKPNKGKSDETNLTLDDDLVDFLRTVSSDKLIEIIGINNFRDISDNRSEQYDAFDEMEKDATIAAALKMYADDATQYNLDGNVIWVESADPNIAEFGNRLLQVLRINEKAWTHIYNLVKYGDVYLETFYDDEVDAYSLVSTPVKGMYGTVAQSHKIGARMEEYVEMVSNPAVIFDLKKRGKTEGYIKLDDDDQDVNIQRVYRVNLSGTQQRILPADKYIHIMLSEESNRYPETFDITFENTRNNENVENGEDNKDIRTYRYTVAKGKSILHDVFKAYRELKLMEDSVLLNRVTRSAITRILQIEVGDMPKPQVKEKLRQIKMMIEQKNFMDTNKGEFTNQASPGPVDNIIYVPVRNGNGAITMDSLGGDVDPKSLIDLEYYKQKESGALGIPLAYLSGQSGDGGGLSSGTALTKLDNKYARTIKRIQTAYIQGITTLLNVFAIRKNLTDYVNNFKVRMVSPSTIEDDDRDQQLDNRINMTSNLFNIINDAEVITQEGKIELVNYLTSSFLNKPEIAKILNDYVKEPEPEETEASDNESMNSTPHSPGMSSDSFDFNDLEAVDISDVPPMNNEESEDALDSDVGITSGEESGFGDFEEFAT